MCVLLTSDQICNALHIERTTLWKLKNNGMPYIRVGKKLIRYDLDEVIAWLKERSVNS